MKKNISVVKQIKEYRQMMKESNQEFIKSIEDILNETKEEGKDSASGYDQGFYNGREDAIEEVLELLKVYLGR
jgi:hypothetical protein